MVVTARIVMCSTGEVTKQYWGVWSSGSSRAMYALRLSKNLEREVRRKREIESFARTWNSLSVEVMHVVSAQPLV